jgi:acyl carrier protein
VDENIVARHIRSYLEKHFPKARRISDNNSLLETGVLDSLGVLDLVAFLEQEFNIRIADEDLIPENFRSVGTIVTFVHQKQNGCK